MIPVWFKVPGIDAESIVEMPCPPRIGECVMLFSGKTYLVKDLIWMLDPEGDHYVWISLKEYPYAKRGL